MPPGCPSRVADHPRGRLRHRPGGAGKRWPGVTPVRSRGRAPANDDRGRHPGCARAFMTAIPAARLFPSERTRGPPPTFRDSRPGTSTEARGAQAAQGRRSNPSRALAASCARGSLRQSAPEEELEVAIGVPIYANAAGIIPVVQARRSGGYERNVGRQRSPRRLGLGPRPNRRETLPRSRIGVRLSLSHAPERVAGQIPPATDVTASPSRKAKGPGDLRHRGPPGLVAGAGFGRKQTCCRSRGPSPFGRRSGVPTSMRGSSGRVWEWPRP
jgi:hypothetical protein